ncbi:DUF3853 family protein [Bergeyella porcorum]|uniref:DUF3853 family protein n=1 Tax=Bergeyella porcorum TaxID=1735111 RepID=UPI0035E9D89E
MVSSSILEKQFLTMTGEEILELFGAIAEQKSVMKDFTSKRYVHGIDGLADLLGCKRTKAQQIKSSGVIDEAVYQSGKIIVIDGDKALELIKLHENGTAY